MYGDDFEKIGNSFTLNKYDMTDDLLLFWGMELEYAGRGWHEQIPEQITIRAVATFNDGKTQEETLTLNFMEMGGIISVSGPIYTPEEIRELILEGHDISKIADAFVNEAKNQGLGEVKVNSVEISGELDDDYKGIWRITYDVLPENGTEWLINQSCDVELSINEGSDTIISLEINEEIAQIGSLGYTVKILVD